MTGEPFDLRTFYREVDRRYRESSGDGVLRFLEGELSRARASGDEDAIVAVASELGSVLRVRGELARAEALYLEAIRILDACPQAPALSRVNLRIHLGDVYVAWGRGTEAVCLFDEAEGLLPCAESHPYQLSAICNNRSSAWRLMGHLPEARRDLRRASALLERVADSEGERAVNGINLAQILLQEGRLEEADAEIAPVLVAYETLSGGRDIHRPNALAVAAQIAYLRGNYARSSALYSEAIHSLADKLGDSDTVRALRNMKARVDRLAG